MSREIELKLEVDPDDLPVVRQNPLLTGVESRTNHQVTLYYDTPETLLKKHGFTLRVRSVGGQFIQTVKPTTDSVGLVSREEIESIVESEKPDLSQLEGHPVHALLNRAQPHPLEPMIRTWGSIALIAMMVAGPSITGIAMSVSTTRMSAR